MKKTVLVVCLLAGGGMGQEVRAQAAQAITAGMSILLNARRGVASPTAPAVTTATYRARTYPMQRTPTAGLGILGGDQVAYVERQLTACHTRLTADSTQQVCTAAQLAQLQTTQAAILRVQPKWPMQPYTQEIAFYLAEDTRRQQAAAPTK